MFWFLSAWSFYFRWPTSPKHIFFTSGILLGPALQSAVFVLLSLFFNVLFLDSRLGILFGLMGLSLLTGFFHEDGFADAFDSLGVPLMGDKEASRARVLQAMRDSRLGTFGVSALCFLWIVRCLGVFSFGLSLWQFSAMIVLSRASGLFAGFLFLRANVSNRASRASHQLLDVSFKWMILAFSGCLVLAAGLLGAIMVHPWLTLGVAFCVCLTAALGVWGWSRRSGEVNGDIIGASICLSELVGLALLPRLLN